MISDFRVRLSRRLAQAVQAFFLSSWVGKIARKLARHGFRRTAPTAWYQQTSGSIQ